MTSNIKRSDLKGKRKKPVPAVANPLFVQWLTEWRDEAVEKGWKSHHTYNKALKTLKLFPVRLEKGKDCKLLQNFGDKICQMLEERLVEHQQKNGSVEEVQERVVPEKAIAKKAIPASTSRKESSSLRTHVISDNSDSDPEKLASPPKKKRQSVRKPREYVPVHRSGPYALILNLYRCMQDPDFKGFLTKNELSHSAQPLCDKSFTIPDPGSHYTAWSSMSTLIKKGLVLKNGCPARFSLTESGFQLGSRLENVERDGHSEHSQSSSYLSEHSQSSSHLSEYCSSRLPGGSESIQNDESSPLAADLDVVKPASHLSHQIVLSDSEGEWNDIINKHKERILDRRHSGKLSNGACDDSILVLSDDEDNNDKVNNVFTESPTLPIKPMKPHSLSPSSSLSAPPSPRPTYTRSPSPQRQLCNDDSFSPWKDNSVLSKNSSPSKSLNKTASPAFNLSYDNGVIEIDNDDGNDGHDNFINLTSEPEPSEFNREVKETYNTHDTIVESNHNDYYNNFDDDDDLPDLEQFIPLSKRLLNKGVVSSSLLNSHLTKTNSEITKPSSVDKVNLKNSSTAIVSTMSTGGIRKESPIDLDSVKTLSSSDKISYTAIHEKNTKGGSSSSSGSSCGYSSLQTVSVPKLNKDMVFQRTSPQLSSDLSEAPSHSSSKEQVKSKPVPTFTLLPGTFDIVLCVDQREFYGSKSSSKTLLPDLIKTGINCDLRHLNISDLLWVARERPSPASGFESGRGRELVLNYAIERKRMDDLVSSISSGRLKEQKFRLRHSGISELIILIEEYGSIQNFSLSEDRIKQTIVNSQIIDGFKVKRCESSKDAVTYLNLMTRYLQSHFHSKTLHAVSQDWLKDNDKSSIHDSVQYLMPFDIFNEASIKQKTLSVREMFAKHLLQIPGISLDRASAITKVYPSLSLLIQAYGNCTSEKVKESLLASIKCGSKDRNLGIAVSRTVCMLYNTKGALS